MKGKETGPFCREQCGYVLELINHLFQLYVWSQQKTHEKMETLESELIRLRQEYEALKKQEVNTRRKRVTLDVTEK